MLLREWEMCNFFNMKKIVLLAVLAVGMLFSVNAQELTWGVRGGLNISTAGDKYTGKVESGESKSDYEQDFKSRLGFHLGVILDWGLSESFYIQPGLYFTTRGAKIKESDEDAKYEEKYNLNYLQLPILASYRIALSDNVKWHINAGPYLAYGIGGKVKWEASYDGESEKGDYKAFGVADEDSDDEKGGLKRFDAGLSFGTGVSFDKVYVGLTYDLGLANIADEDAWGKDYKLKNRNFAITVGYTF